jgi:hypothetical protein
MYASQFFGSVFLTLLITIWPAKRCRYSDSLRPGGLGVLTSVWERRFILFFILFYSILFYSIHSCGDRFWGPPNFLCFGCLGSLPGVMRPKYGFHHPVPSSSEVKNEYSNTCIPPLCLHDLLWGDLYLLLVNEFTVLCLCAWALCLRPEGERIYSVYFHSIILMFKWRVFVHSGLIAEGGFLNYTVMNCRYNKATVSPNVIIARKYLIFITLIQNIKDNYKFN